MLSDLRYAFRSLAKSPGFTTVAILTLAVAIGVNTAVFSLVNGLLLRSAIPYKPAEVLNIFTARKATNRDYRQFSHAEFTTLREANPIFRDIAAFNFTFIGIGRDESLRRCFGFSVSENFFSFMGIQPAAGRFFNSTESQPNANIPVAVAGYPLWQRMGGRPDFIGSTIQVNGQPFTIIGVTPSGFTGINLMITPEIWLPLGVYSQLTNLIAENGPTNDLVRPTDYALNLMGRLNPGVDLRSAGPQLPVLARRLNTLHPPEAATTDAREIQIQKPSALSLSTEPQNDNAVTALAVLVLCMAAVVLLIACLNLVNMLLARGTSRTKEVAIRLALGAPRWRIIRQLLAEGLLLALGGGALGLLLAQWSNALLTESMNNAFRAMNFSTALELRPDATVLGATFLFCLVATLIFSLGPALKSVRVDLVHDLKQQTGDTGKSGRWNKFFSARHCLVMTQISLSLALLFCGGLFFRGALNATSLDLGFEPAGRAIAEIDYALTRAPETLARQRMAALLTRVQEQPGVRSAALATILPYGSFNSSKPIAPAEAASSTGTNTQRPGINGAFSAITSDYFEALGVTLISGRKFTTAEVEDRRTPSVAIIDARMATMLFPNGDALGRRIRYTFGMRTEMEIVGIVSNYRKRPRAGDMEPCLYVPLAQSYSPNISVIARFATDKAQAAVSGMAEMRKTLRATDPDLPILRLALFTDLIDGHINIWIARLGAVIFGIFGGIALLLAIVGVYGIKAYSVAQRTREIGIHMALGAMPRNVFTLFMKQGALQVTFAVVTGIVLSLLIGKSLSSFLVGVSPADPVVLGTAITILTSTALLACYLPARRATRVNPIKALRAE